MQTRKKRTETISETTTLLIMKNSTAEASVVGWCEQCCAEVLWIASEALTLFGISGTIKRGGMHIRGGSICSRSLIEEVKKEKI